MSLFKTLRRIFAPRSHTVRFALPLVFLFTAVFAIFFDDIVSPVRVQDQEWPTSQAVISVLPLAREVSVGEDIPVNVYLTTKTQSNALVFEVFVPDNFKVQDINREDSSVDLWVQDPIVLDTPEGTVIQLGGGSTAGNIEGTILSLTLRAVTAGEATVDLREVQILAHDGLGTQLRTDIQQGKYRIIES